MASPPESALSNPATSHASALRASSAMGDLAEIETRNTPLAILPTDGELLMLFTQEESESAFDRLVERHGGMVWRVCRSILLTQQDVEDAYQATFLLLASKANQIRANESAAGWLYRVAYRTALSAKRRAKRRREESLEAEPAAPPEEAFPDLIGRQMVSLLLEELKTMPKKYQTPLVMRYLEGQSRRAIADQTDMTVAAVQGKLSRGKQLLRRRLVRRGVSLSIAMGVVGAAGRSTEAASPALIAKTAADCHALVAGSGSIAASSAVLALYQEGTRAMLFASMTKPAATLATCVFTVALWMGAGVGGNETANHLPNEDSGAFQLSAELDSDESFNEAPTATVQFSQAEVSSPPERLPEVKFKPYLEDKTTEVTGTLEPGKSIPEIEFGDWAKNGKKLPDAEQNENLKETWAQTAAQQEGLQLSKEPSMKELHLQHIYSRSRYSALKKKTQAIIQQFDGKSTSDLTPEQNLQLIEAELLSSEVFRARAETLRLERELMLRATGDTEQELSNASEVSSSGIAGSPQRPTIQNGNEIEHWPNGKTKAEREYRDGRLITSIEYNEEGKVVYEMVDRGPKNQQSPVLQGMPKVWGRQNISTNSWGTVTPPNNSYSQPSWGPTQNRVLDAPTNQPTNRFNNGAYQSPRVNRSQANQQLNWADNSLQKPAESKERYFAQNKRYGYSVAKLQEALNKHLKISPTTKMLGAIGLAATELDIDGDYGPRTEAAVREFQTQANLPTTGFADAATRKALGLTDKPIEREVSEEQKEATNERIEIGVTHLTIDESLIAFNNTIALAIIDVETMAEISRSNPLSQLDQTNSNTKYKKAIEELKLGHLGAKELSQFKRALDLYRAFMHSKDEFDQHIKIANEFLGYWMMIKDQKYSERYSQGNNVITFSPAMLEEASPYKQKIEELRKKVIELSSKYPSEGVIENLLEQINKEDRLKAAANNPTQRSQALAIQKSPDSKIYAYSVDLLQENLNKKLVPPPNPLLEVDGDYGPLTRTAVSLFQKQVGLPRSGFADEKTREALELTDQPISNPITKQSYSFPTSLASSTPNKGNWRALYKSSGLNHDGLALVTEIKEGVLAPLFLSHSEPAAYLFKIVKAKGDGCQLVFEKTNQSSQAAVFSIPSKTTTVVNLHGMNFHVTWIEGAAEDPPLLVVRTVGKNPPSRFDRTSYQLAKFLLEQPTMSLEDQSQKLVELAKQIESSSLSNLSNRDLLKKANPNDNFPRAFKVSDLLLMELRTIDDLLSVAEKSADKLEIQVSKFREGSIPNFDSLNEFERLSTSKKLMVYSNTYQSVERQIQQLDSRINECEMNYRSYRSYRSDSKILASLAKYLDDAKLRNSVLIERLKLAKLTMPNITIGPTKIMPESKSKNINGQRAQPIAKPAPQRFGLPHRSIYLSELRAMRSYQRAPGDIPAQFEYRVGKQIDQRSSQALQNKSPLKFIVGRVVVDEGDDPTLVSSQMKIFKGGYFLDIVRDLNLPVGFRRHGYDARDISLEGKEGLVIDVGEVRLKKTDEKSHRKISGKVVLEDEQDNSIVKVTLKASNGPLNNYTYGWESGRNEPKLILVPVDSQGNFKAEGLSPIKYHVYFNADNYARQFRNVDLSQPHENGELGTITLQ